MKLRLYHIRCDRAREIGLMDQIPEYGRIEFTCLFEGTRHARTWWDAKFDYSAPPVIARIPEGCPSSRWKGLHHFTLDAETGDPSYLWRWG